MFHICKELKKYIHLARV